MKYGLHYFFVLPPGNSVCNDFHCKIMKSRRDGVQYIGTFQKYVWVGANPIVGANMLWGEHADDFKHFFKNVF